ncbi:MAG: lysozyme inhibitor LprI family protein [Pseudomonadota bacterium]
MGCRLNSLSTRRDRGGTDAQFEIFQARPDEPLDLIFIPINPPIDESEPLLILVDSREVAEVSPVTGFAPVTTLDRFHIQDLEVRDRLIRRIRRGRLLTLLFTDSQGEEQFASFSLLGTSAGLRSLERSIDDHQAPIVIDEAALGVEGGLAPSVFGPRPKPQTSDGGPQAALPDERSGNEPRRPAATLDPLSPMAAACQSYGNDVATKRDGRGIALQVFEDDAFVKEPYPSPIALADPQIIVTGHGIIERDGLGEEDIGFLCLVSSRTNRAVFFHYDRRSDVPALERCRQTNATRDTLEDCLGRLLNVAQAALNAERSKVALAIAAIPGRQQREDSVDHFDESQAAWEAFRTAECQRRNRLASPGNGREAVQLSCLVDLTFDRAAQLQRP